MSRDSQAGVELPARRHARCSLNAATPPPVGRACSIGALNVLADRPQNGASTHCVPLASCHALSAPQMPRASNACASLQMSGVVCSVVR